MSAGTSTSRGTGWSKADSDALKTILSSQTGQQEQAGTGTTVSQQATPRWAMQANKADLNRRAETDSMARDFLSGLLSDPYDKSQPQNNRFAAALGRAYDTALARARSQGGSNGVAKNAFREAAALTGAQDAAIAQGKGAADSLLQGSDVMRNLQFAQSTGPTTQTTNNAARTLSQEQSRTRESTQAQQNTKEGQFGKNVGHGITVCCFIFLQAYDGTLPWFVRRCRDEFASGPRVEGYRKLSKRLVPLMRRSKLITMLVRMFMTQPLTKWGGWLYGEEKYKFGFLWFPIVFFWFTLFSLMGKTIELED